MLWFRAAQSDLPRSGPEGADRRRRLGHALGGALLALALALPAGATPVDVFFGGSDSVGITPASESAAAGMVPTRTPERLFVEEQLAIERSGEMSGSLGPPARGSTDWTVRNDAEEEVFEQLWIVFRGHLGGDNDPLYDDLAAGQLGLTIGEGNRWALMEGRLGTYPAYFLGSLVPGSFEGECSFATPEICDLVPFGDLDGGNASNVPLDYVFNGTLQANAEGSLLFPRMKVGFAQAPIPEPTTVGLLGVGLIGLALAGRRR